jgi:acyl carrier protein
MLTQARNKDTPSKSAFPREWLRENLRHEFDEIAEESAVVHGGWEPVLDSLRVVTIISKLEDMFDFPLPPEKIVRKGGYSDVRQAMDDVEGNLERLWDKYH